MATTKTAQPERPVGPPAPPAETAQPKNPAAQALAKQRWQKTPPEERQRILAQVARAGWQGARGEARREKAIRLAIQEKTPAGRPREAERCPCGANTLKRAQARKFDCCRRSPLDLRKLGLRRIYPKPAQPKP